MPFIVHIDASQLVHGDNGFEEAISHFFNINIKNSYLVQAGKIKKLSEFKELKDANPWNRINDNNWLICNKKNEENEIVIKELSRSSESILTNFDEYSQKLMKSFGWVIFRNFTTYHKNIISFMTNSEEKYKSFYQIFKSRISYEDISHYDRKETCSKNLRNITFYDYGMEGYYAYLLSQKENITPYLICCFEMEDEEYRKWDNYLDKYIGSPWFLKHLKHLSNVDSFSIAHLRYKIFKVTTEEHYLKIWSMASDDLSVADYVISGESNIELVIDCIKNSIGFSTIVPWGYTQIYGGGSDEHHAYFHSLDAEATEFVSAIISDTNDLIARF